MKFSYSTANLIFFRFLIILLILPIFYRLRSGKFQTQKSLPGIRFWAITFIPIKRGSCLPQVTAIKFLGDLAEKIFQRQTKATLGTRGFSRVQREFLVLAEGRHIFGRRPNSRAASKDLTESGNRARKVSGTQGKQNRPLRLKHAILSRHSKAVKSMKMLYWPDSTVVRKWHSKQSKKSTLK